MVWADGENNILKEEPISSVAQIKKIIGRNLEYLPKLLPSPVQEAPSPAQKTRSPEQIVSSLTADLKKNSATLELDSALLKQIREDLKELKTALQQPAVSAKIDRQISAKRIPLKPISNIRRKELLTATSDKDIEEANIRFTSVQSIITNINTCIARITDHLKSKQEPIIDPSLSQAASPNKQAQEAASASELAQTKTDPAEEHRDIQTPALGATAEETINSQKLQRKELYTTFQKEKGLRDKLIDQEKTAQQERIKSAKETAIQKKAEKVEKAKEAERLRKNSFDEEVPNSRPVMFAPRQPPPPIKLKREASTPAEAAKSLEDEEAALPNERTQEQTRDELVKEQDAKQLIEELKQLTLDLKTAKSREDIDKIENRRSDWGNKEDEFYDKYLKHGDSDSKENKDILSRINQQNKLYGDALRQAELKVQSVVTASEERREEPRDVLKAPQLELLSREASMEEPAVITAKNATPPSAVPPLATDAPLKASAPHKEPRLDSVSPETRTRPLSDLSARLKDTAEKFVESDQRQSVLHCPDQSVGVSFHKENFCREFATEYNNNIEEGKKITVIDNSSPQEATDNPLTKKLSFSADGKTVTLPKDNIVHDTVCALNNIARSNMRNRNKGSDFSEPVIKIKEVQEKDLLDILQKFNAGITASIVEPDASTSTNLKGHLQLSYENPNPGSPNEVEIQNIIKQHNDLHATLQKENADPEKVQEKLVALKSAITALDNKLTTPEPSSVKPAEPEHDSAHHSVRLR